MSHMELSEEREDDDDKYDTAFGSQADKIWRSLILRVDVAANGVYEENSQRRAHGSGAEEHSSAQVHTSD